MVDQWPVLDVAAGVRPPSVYYFEQRLDHLDELLTEQDRLVTGDDRANPRSDPACELFDLALRQGSLPRDLADDPDSGRGRHSEPLVCRP